MDLSSFKLLHEDDELFHIEHPSGKKLLLEKSKLKGRAPELIKNMNKGGVAHYNEGAAPVSQEDVQPAIPDALLPSPAAQPMVQAPVQIGGEVPQQAVAAPPVAQDQSAQGMLANKQGGVEKALRAQEGFQTQEAQAMANQQKQEASALAQTQKQIAAMPTQQDIINQNKIKDEALMQAFQDKKIDPNRLFKEMGTGSKITAGLALVLGGIGSGLTGQPNQAAKMIQDLVERDVDAQKADQSKAMNAWKMNKESLGNDLAANLATQNQLYTGLKYKLMQAAAQNASPAILARVGAGNTLIDQKIEQNRFQQSLIQYGTGSGNKNQGGYSGEDPSALVPHLVPPERQKDVFNEIEAAQNTKKNAGEIMKAYDEMVKEQRLLSKNVLPGVHSAQIDKLHALLGPTFQDVEGTVRQAAMDNLYKSIETSVGDSSDKDAIHREALEHYIKYKSSAPTAKGFGIDLSKFSSTASPEFSSNPKVQQFMRDNPNIQNEQEAVKILKEHGKL